MGRTRQKAKQGVSVQVGPVKISRGNLTEWQRDEIEGFMNRLIIGVLYSFDPKENEPDDLFDERYGRTLRLLRNATGDMLHSQVPKTTKGKERLAKTHSRNVSDILRSAGFSEKVCKRVLTEIQVELLGIFLKMKKSQSEGTVLPVNIRRRGRLDI